MATCRVATASDEEVNEQNEQKTQNELDTK